MAPFFSQSHFILLKMRQLPALLCVLHSIMGSPKLTSSFQFATFYFVMNWASDQNNYIICVQNKLSWWQHCWLTVQWVVLRAIKLASTNGKMTSLFHWQMWWQWQIIPRSRLHHFSQLPFTLQNLGQRPKLLFALYHEDTPCTMTTAFLLFILWYAMSVTID